MILDHQFGQQLGVELLQQLPGIVVDVGLVARVWGVPADELAAVLASYGHPVAGELSDRALLTLVNHFGVQQSIEESVQSMRQTVAARRGQ